jgi:hypothetical protein
LRVEVSRGEELPAEVEGIAEGVSVSTLADWVPKAVGLSEMAE